MKIQFIGATHEVTGSCTLLEVGGRYYVVDCGMEQGKDVFQNIDLPIAASSIEAAFLTHAHIDHSGMLPKLVKEGFKGAIYATDVTCDLCAIMLADSAHIQESEAQWQSKRNERAGLEKVEPAYTTKDAMAAVSQFRRCTYGEVVEPAEGISVRFTDIGHLLGSACIELWLTEGDITKKIVFSGDVGNKDQRIICDPQPVEEADYLVIESTYGNRLHDGERQYVVDELAEHIQRTLDKGGNLIIPSFAIGRTQEMLYAIREIKQKGLVKGHDGFPVYVDSPLAAEATSIFIQCNPVCFDEETLSLLKAGVNPIWFDDIRMTMTSEESKQINFDPQPKVIIAASGMCEAGRIRHHLKHNLWKKSTTVLFVGYQAEGSLGRKLIEGEKRVSLFGEKITVNADITSLHGISGHADRDGLYGWLSAFSKKPQLVFVNHGDNDACEDFKAFITERGYNAEAPYSGSEYDLAADGKTTLCAEGKPIERKAHTEKAVRADNFYNELVDAARKLLTLAQECRGRANKDNTAFAEQIRALYDKWE